MNSTGNGGQALDTFRFSVHSECVNVMAIEMFMTNQSKNHEQTADPGTFNPLASRTTAGSKRRVRHRNHRQEALRRSQIRFGWALAIASGGGIVFGVVMGNLAVGAGIGLTLGLAIGLLISG